MSGGTQSGVFIGEVEVFGCLGEDIGPMTIMSDLSQLNLRMFACIKDVLAETE